MRNSDIEAETANELGEPGDPAHAPERTSEAAPTPASDTPIRPRESLRRMIMGFRTTQIVYVVAKLGVADLLRDGPRKSGELANACGAHAPTLYRLLRAAASLDLLTEAEDGRFGLTVLGEGLLSESGGSLRDVALLYGEDWCWRSFGALEESVRTGEVAFGRVHGMGLFDHLERDPRAAEVFDRAMSAFTESDTASILAAFDFSAYETVVDVGGGQGALLAAVVKAHPRMRGLLADRPPLERGALARWQREGVADRCRFEACDFFRSVPRGGDLYLLKRVIHDWGDEEAVAILGQCREAIRTDGRLILIERVIPPGHEASEAKLFDINMLVTAGGQERTEAEYARLMARAGFALVGVHATGSSLGLVEGQVA